MLNDIRKHPYFSGFLLVVLALTVLGLQGCIHATYEAPDGTKVGVTSFTPMGGTTEIEAKAEGDKRSLSVNREQGSAEGVIDQVGDIVNPVSQ